MKIYLSAVLSLLLGFIYSSTAQATSFNQGLKCALLGDSMTWIGGDSCENATGWSNVLKECGKVRSIETYARSGATWTNTSNTRKDLFFYSEVLHDDNVVYNQALRLIEAHKSDSISDIDCIIVFAGANDAWFSSCRPGLYDEISISSSERYSDETDPRTITSLYGSVALVCDLLNRYFPKANLTIVTPLQMSKVSADDIHKTSNIIESAALSRGCAVLRADREVGITHDIESKSPTYTYDGVHTNPEGATILGNYILKFLLFHLNSSTDIRITQNE